jgi:hypothetical protein
LLFCENDIDNSDDFKVVLEAFRKFREQDRYSVFDFSKVKEALADTIKTEKLEQNISLIAKLSPIISESLYGNPRQIKRFLNTFMLRKKLAGIAKIPDFKDDVLAKLMILEYAEPKLFEILYNWQISNNGIAKPIEDLENACKIEENEKVNIPDDYKEWKNKPKIVNWISTNPLLSKVDLRDYFWISRDKLSSMQSNLLIPPIIRSLMQRLEPTNMPEKSTRNTLKELQALSQNDQLIFFQLLKQKIVIEPNIKRNYDLFKFSLEENLDCKSFYIDVLHNVGKKKLPPAVVESLKGLVDKHPEFNEFINQEQKRKS